MKKKSKGMTLIEIIIALSLTTVVLVVIGTFLFTNSKMLSTADVKSELQKDADNIQTELVKRGTESCGIASMKIDPSGSTENANTILYSRLDANLELSIASLNFLHYQDETLTSTKNYSFELTKAVGAETGKLVMKLPNGSEKVLSENVQSVIIKPTDAASVPDKTTATFNDTKAIEVRVNLKKKSGFVDESLPVNMVIKMRNKGAIDPNK